MALIRIDAKPFNSDKPYFIVKPTGALFDAAINLQLEMVEQDELPENGGVIEIFKKQKQLVDDIEKFLKKVLGLTSKQYKDFNEANEKETVMTYTSYVVAMLQGYTEGTFEEFLKGINDINEDETDPKEDQSKSEN